MINLKLVNELMVDFSNGVYEIIEDQQPRFLVEEFQTTVQMCRAIALGQALPHELELITSLADDVQSDVMTYVNDRLTLAAKFDTLKIKLGQLYRGAAYRVTNVSEAEEDIEMSLIQIISEARGAMKLFADGNEILEQKLLNLLDELTQGVVEGLQ